MSMSLPHSVTRYFWGDNLQELNPQVHAKYITQTLLEKGDSEALDWLFSIFPSQAIKTMLPDLKLSKKSAHFWQVYLS